MLKLGLESSVIPPKVLSINLTLFDIDVRLNTKTVLGKSGKKFKKKKTF